ncbi:MAG: WG repeat-containing protein [Candidatus Methanomethylophilaceae archaeon]|nr:WG repeat-containing protein [Candidatus Methanomethylophilaceae archaeon]
MKPTLLTWLTALTLTALTGCKGAPDFPTPDHPMYGDCDNCEQMLLSPDMHVIPTGDGLVSVWNDCTGWMIRDIRPDWEILFPSDSLILYRNAKGKYGFMYAPAAWYRIPAMYDLAWPFSEGIAAVMKDKRIHFIDTFGKPAAGGFSFPWNGHYVDRPIFTNGVCAAADENRLCGVIDRDGRWVVEPRYKDVQMLEEGILCESPGVSVLYGFDGEIINPCIVGDVIRLTFKGAPVNACKYEVNERFGLMDLEGRRLTDALYDDVLALTGNLYGGRLTDGKSLVVLNGKGEVVRTRDFVKE